MRMLLRSTALVVALGTVIAAGSASAGASERDGERPVDGRAVKLDSADRMIAEINRVRAEHGLRALRRSPRLVRSSRGYAGHLIRTNRFVHGSAYARTGFRRSGEILALRSGPGHGRQAPFLDMWLRSSGHAALILDRRFRYIGASPASGNFSGAPTTIWVAHFGAR